MTNNKWFNIWYEDKQNMVNTMMRNLTADLDAGYNPFGQVITRERNEIRDYINKMDEQLDKLAMMDEKKAERWCYVDLKRRGAIC